MLKFKEVKELLNRAKVALQQYRDFELSYEGRETGNIYQSRKRYFYEKLTTYENNLKQYGTGSWVTWKGLIEYKDSKNKVIQKNFKITLPENVSKPEVEALISFKLYDSKMLKEFVVLEVKPVVTFSTGCITFTSEQ